MFNFDKFKDDLTNNHEHTPQRVALGTLALDAIQNGLSQLAGLGYRMTLVQIADHPTVAASSVDPEAVVAANQQLAESKSAEIKTVAIPTSPTPVSVPIPTAGDPKPKEAATAVGSGPAVAKAQAQA